MLNLRERNDVANRASPLTLSTISLLVRARSPRSSAASAPSASFRHVDRGRKLRRHRGQRRREGREQPMRCPCAAACSIIASLGLSTGIGACACATASMQGPKAEQVNRIAFAPVAAA
jgi:hypothetical protein